MAVTKQPRLILIVSILASLVAFLDSSVANVALPAIVRELGGGLVTQQWVVNAYLITLGSLILLAGSLSDVIGRVRVLVIGLIGFGLASLAVALAPSASLLIVARAFQGMAGALLVPSSLALIIANFEGSAQGKAIGSWTAWTGISFIIGPLLGGFLVDVASWRWAFGINIIPIILTLYLLTRLRDVSDKPRSVRLDLVGAALVSAGLAGIVYALIEQARYGWQNPLIVSPFIGGLLLIGLFIGYESRTAAPMLPLQLFKVRNFSVGNIATASIYAGLSVATFLIVIFLQQVAHYSALAAGLALLPVTLIMFFLSARVGALAGRFGPRWFMTLGPLLGAVGFTLLLRIDAAATYWTQVFPAIVVFGLGLATTVAPLTAAVLGDIDQQHAGIGSAINNAISRIAGLLAIAAVGVVIGGGITLASFHQGVWFMAILLAVGGIISALGIR